MNKMVKFLAIIGLITLTALVTCSLSDEKATKNRERKTSEYYQIKAIKINDDLTFAGEKVPIDDSEVFERIDREILVNTYWQSNTLLYIKRANKYFPVIEPILARYGVPDDFKYLAVIESGLMNVTSPAGAKGFWQIMTATGKEYGLEINEQVDERYHIEKSTETACKFLLNAKKDLGSWAMAAAAYNAGNKGVSDRKSQQKQDNYYDLLLLDETARYVPRLVAIKEIMEHPAAYGFLLEKEDLYTPQKFSEVQVDSTVINLTDFAGKFEMSYKELKNLNPWLRDTSLQNKTKKKYFVKIKSN